MISNYTHKVANKSDQSSFGEDKPSILADISPMKRERLGIILEEDDIKNIEFHV